MGREIFLSYPSDQAGLAERLELALEAAGHDVFRDRTELHPGEAFDARIRAALDDSDLFLFLITPRSVAEGSYTLAEVTFARQKWPHPDGHVLPVIVAPTPFDRIPEYLKAVTVLAPRGEVAAEIVAAVGRMALPWRRRWRRPRRLALGGAALVLALGAAWVATSRLQERRDRDAAVAARLQAADVRAQSGDYAAAWAALEAARAEHPRAAGVIDAQERLAMTWLQDIRGSQLTGNFRDIVDTVTPVVAAGAVGAGPRAADLRAHLGWAEFLKSRDGVSGLNPAAHYDAALSMDPGNVFAHAMRGFHLLAGAGAGRAVASLPEARTHFAEALRAGRERGYVRRMQCAAALWHHHPVLEIEAVRVANAIRLAGEPLPQWPGSGTLAGRLWMIYTARLANGDDPAGFLAALSPDEHLATFRWLYGDGKYDGEIVPFLAVRGPIEEHAGERAAALATARALLAEMEKAGDPGGRLAVRARADIERLSGS